MLLLENMTTNEIYNYYFDNIKKDFLSKMSDGIFEAMEEYPEDSDEITIVLDFSTNSLVFLSGDIEEKNSFYSYSMGEVMYDANQLLIHLEEKEILKKEWEIYELLNDGITGNTFAFGNFTLLVYGSDDYTQNKWDIPFYDSDDEEEDEDQEESIYIQLGKNELILEILNNYKERELSEQEEDYLDVLFELIDLDIEGNVYRYQDVLTINLDSYSILITSTHSMFTQEDSDDVINEPHTQDFYQYLSKLLDWETITPSNSLPDGILVKTGSNPEFVFYLLSLIHDFIETNNVVKTYTNEVITRKSEFTFAEFNLYGPMLHLNIAKEDSSFPHGWESYTYAYQPSSGYLQFSKGVDESHTVDCTDNEFSELVESLPSLLVR